MPTTKHSDDFVDLMHRHLRSVKLAPIEDDLRAIAALTVMPSTTEDAGSDREVEQVFRENLQAWREACRLSSSASEIVMHPAYQRIIGLGRPVLPYILRDLERRPGHWGWALRALTGCNPVPSEEAGDLARIAQRWIEWARENEISW